MNIVIAGNFLFPFGGASASRIRHFARGLSELGISVHVISEHVIDDRPEDITNDGSRCYKGIKYKSANGYKTGYTHNKTILDSMLWYRRWLQGIHETTKEIKQLIESEKVDVLLQYTTNYIAMHPFDSYCKRKGILLIRDIVEWPVCNFFKGGALHPLYWDNQLGVRKSMIHSDGIIGISKFLTERYRGQKIPALTIPAIIEIPSDIPEYTPIKDEFNLVYLGALAHRDGPFEMIGAIQKVLSKGLKVTFTIVGSPDNHGIGLKLKNICENTPALRGRVKFTGHVDDAEVVKRLNSANALLFVRPDDICAKAAFPTRLPEYLITGRPVIVSGVGDIPMYLRNGIDAMIVKQCTPSAIAEQIERLINMNDWGQSIGIAGFKQAKKFFDYKTRANEIYNFIQELQQKPR